jgi:hypothetical protein
MGGDKVKVQKNKIVKLGTDEEQVQVIDVYSIADSFKGLTVKFENASVIEDLTKEFSKNILRVFPDQDIKFDLPKPKNKKRFLARSRSQKRAERKGNYDPDTFDKFGKPDDLELENTTLSKRAATSYSRQTGAQWNLVRISQHRRDLSQPYIYDSNAG